MTMKSYWAIPEDAVDDAERAAKWGRLAVEASRRAEAAKAPKKKKVKVKAPARKKKPAARARAKAR